METEKSKLKINESGAHGSILSYVLGFVLSLALTIAAYVVVEIHIHSGHLVISHHVLLTAILGFAVLQFIIQAIFFLHLHRETGPRWNLAIFLSTIGLVLIIVGGSLWIMEHLNYNMTPAEMNVYILNQD